MCLITFTTQTFEKRGHSLRRGSLVVVDSDLSTKKKKKTFPFKLWHFQLNHICISLQQNLSLQREMDKIFKELQQQIDQIRRFKETDFSTRGSAKSLSLRQRLQPIIQSLNEIKQQGNCLDSPLDTILLTVCIFGSDLVTHFVQIYLMMLDCSGVGSKPKHLIFSMNTIRKQRNSSHTLYLLSIQTSIRINITKNNLFFSIIR
jgi:hypothetical protein